MKTALLVLSFLLCTAATDLAQTRRQTPPKVPYWHVWTDDKGVSHQTRGELSQFELQSIQPPALPQWLNHLKAEGATITVAVKPPGYEGGWHENPKAQWIIPLSGR